MPHKRTLKKERRPPIRKPGKHMSTKNEYQKNALISNLCLIGFSALFMIGLFLPYVYPAASITDGAVGKSGEAGPVTAMQLFVFSILYPGAMSLVCVLSILSIILEKSFKQIIIVCILVCLPEFLYYSYYLGTEFIFARRGLRPFGPGFYLLFVSAFGLLVSSIYHNLNEN